MRATRGAAAIAMAGALAFGTVACSGSDSGDKPTAAADNGFTELSVEEIKTQTLADMGALDSVALTADVTANGEDLAMDVALTSDGGCTGSIEVQGGTAQILVVNDSTYLKGDKAFWAASGGTDMLATVGDKWAKLPAGGSGFDSFCTLDSLLEGFDKPTEGDSVTKGDTVELDGQETIQLVNAKDDGGISTTWITTGDTHYILKVERTGEANSGTLEFSNFNEPVDLVEPGAADVFDLSTG